MKKIARKLIFSSLALGASVLTLTTTTYAWYVQNNTATASNITAKTASNDSDTLLISKDGTGAWNSQLDLSTESLASLVPASLKTGYSGFAADQFCLPTDEKNAATPSDPAAGKAKVISTSFYLVSSNSAMTVVPTLIVKNTTGVTNPGDPVVLPEQTAYSTQGNDITAANITAGTNNKFTVDAVRALRMAVVLTPEGGSATTAVYDVMSIAKSGKTGNAWDAYTAVAGSKDYHATAGTDTGLTSLYGANAYYKSVVGAEPKFGFTEITASPATTFADITLALGTKVKVEVFNIALVFSAVIVPPDIVAFP